MYSPSSSTAIWLILEVCCYNKNKYNWSTAQLKQIPTFKKDGHPTVLLNKAAFKVWPIYMKYLTQVTKSQGDPRMQSCQVNN